MPKITRQLRHASLIVGLVAVSALVGISGTLASDDNAPVFSEERNHYMALEFYPKYRADECTISFDLHVNEPGVQFITLIQESFQRYVSYHEPRVGAMQVEYVAVRRKSPPPRIKDAVPFEVVLSDQCDRKDEIFEAMVGYTQERHAGIFDFERRLDAKPELKSSAFWLDSADYDPAYWPLYHNAMRGDGKAFLELLRFVNEDDFSRQHLFSALAEHYLPDGHMKNIAQEGKRAAWLHMTPKQRDRQNRIVEGWILQINNLAD